MRKITIIVICLISFNSGIAQDIIYDDVDIMCLNLSGLNRGLVIATYDEYSKLLKNLSAHPDCSSYSLPEIDFTNKILLGFRVNSKGCSAPQYRRRIYMTNSEIIFSVDVTENGMCKMLHEITYWVTIPMVHNANVRFVTNVK